MATANSQTKTTVRPPQPPKFNVSRMAGCTVVLMNKEMTQDHAALLDSFEELEPHEFTLRQKLQSSQASQENWSINRLAGCIDCNLKQDFGLKLLDLLDGFEDNELDEEELAFRERLRLFTNPCKPEQAS